MEFRFECTKSDYRAQSLNGSAMLSPSMPCAIGVFAAPAADVLAIPELLGCQYENPRPGSSVAS